MTTEELKNPKLGEYYVCSRGQPMPTPPPEGTQWIHLCADENDDSVNVCTACGFMWGKEKK